MFRNILLPMDLSDRHGAALKVAAELVGQSAGGVTLLHVIETIAGLPIEEEKDFYQRLEKTAHKQLKQLEAELTTRNIPCRLEVRLGNRVAETVRFAKESASDLIVLTAPQLDPDNPAAGWGSLSYKVSFFAPCPVLLVK